jgi:hypothetical protein
MDSWNGAHKACRNCYFYQPQGHRGGECQRLRVPVQSHWAICPLGRPTFAEGRIPAKAAGLDVPLPLPAPVLTPARLSTEGSIPTEPQPVAA